MPKAQTLEELITLADGLNNLNDTSDFILKLYKENDDLSLECITQMAMYDFGGITFKAEFQCLWALSVLHWGPKRLKKLGQKTITTNSFRPSGNVTRLLSHISSKSLSEFMYGNSNLESIKILDPGNEKYKTDEWILAAKETLIDVVQGVEKDELFPSGIMLNLNGFTENEIMQEHLFAALVARWFNFNPYGLDSFQTLIAANDKAEIDYQNFLKTNPYILEPFHAQIWSKPRFGESLVPDFLIRSMDNAYTVVEIEQPGFQIITKNGELSAKTTHAKRQALDFRDWAIDNNLYAIKSFPQIYRPFCLVVIGRESELDEMQMQRLKQENESTQGVLKIVGFDWLYNRARFTLENLVRYGFERNTFPGNN